MNILTGVERKMKGNQWRTYVRSKASSYSGNYLSLVSLTEAAALEWMLLKQQVWIFEWISTGSPSDIKQHQVSLTKREKMQMP